MAVLRPLTVTAVLAGGGALTTLSGAAAGLAVTLDPFGIKIFSVTGDGPQFPISARPQ